MSAALRSWLTPLRLGAAVIVLLAATVLILLNVQSDDYVLLPDVAHPVAPLVRVQGAKPAPGSGTIYFVDVVEQRASEFEALFPWIHSHATFVPAKLIVPPGTTSRAAEQAALREMSISQRIAGAVALRQLGYHVGIDRNGVIVNVVELGTHAYGKLQPADVILGIDGKRTPTIAALRHVLGQVKPGQVVAIRLRRGKQVLVERIQTVADPQQPGHALVGFEPAQAARILLPRKVSIDAGGVGGPSAGLAFALEVMEKLGHDVAHGLHVAATGEMELNGQIAPIGGVEQKTYGVRAAKADVFLVPAGENAQTARRYAGKLRIIPVRTFSQALHALATLAPKR